MAPKRPAEPTSSSSSDEAASSSDEGHEEEPLSSPSQHKTAAQKKPTNSPAPAPKPTPSQRPVAVSSDDDDDDDEGGSSDGDEDETSASESDDDRTKKQPPPKPAPQPTASGSGNESGFESDPEEESESSDMEPAPARLPFRSSGPSIKPVNSKPMDEAPLPKKPAPVSSRDSEPLKKKAKAPEPSKNEGGGPRRQLFQRIWSPDDEIVILSGLVEYRSKKGRLPPFNEMDQLHNQIRGSLQVEVGSNQLHYKIRRLKRKFATNSARGKNGADPTFSKPQERTVFELSKKIWGPNKIVSDDAGARSGEESDSDVAGHRNAKEENAACPAVSPSIAIALAIGNDIYPEARRYPLLSVAVAKMANECKCGVAMKKALEKLEDSKGRAMEEKAKRLKMTEMKLHLRRMDLMKETVKHIFEALAKSDG